MNVWLCAWPDGKSAHDRAAELAAREVVASGKAKRAVVYRVWVDIEGNAA